MSTANVVAKLLLEHKAVALRTEPPFRYSSGILSPIYCDNRVLIGSITARTNIVNYFLELIEENRLHADVVAGTATAGIPWAAWVAEHLDKPLCYVRSKSKDHGKQNQIEGAEVNNKNVLVIEDLISTGGSSISAVQALREAGAQVDTVVAIFTYELPKAIAAFRHADCQLYALSTFSSLITIAQLPPEQKEIVTQWNQDSIGWGSKMGFE